jgi:UPF0755 protein
MLNQATLPKTSPHSRQTALALAGLVAFGIVVVVGLGMFTDPNRFTDAPEKTLFVSHGQPFSSVVDSLEAAGIIRSRFCFMVVATLMGGEKQIQGGKYVFRSGISNLALLRALREGTGAAHITVTIPEGLLARAQASALAQMVGLDSAAFMALVYDESFAQSLGIASHSLEGYLMPDTYDLPWQPDAREVILRMVDRFKFFFDDTLQARTKKLGYTTNQIVTLASIVEGEAILGQELAIISGVYHNRLRMGMKLQADPTIQYLLNDAPRRIFLADLLVESPYNTYRVAGLPPGPVNNPSRDAIRAALYPEDHAYLFFVADGKGGHWFSTNFRDHEKNIRKYRRYIKVGAPQVLLQDTAREMIQYREEKDR